VNVEGQITKNILGNAKTMILFDEINLASSEVLSYLTELFNPDVDTVKIKDTVFFKGNTIFIGAMNPFNEQ
jgi:hypothetical protein